MKRVAFVVGLVVLVFAVSVWAQTMAPKPDPEIKKFDVFLGHWTYTVEYKAGPLGPASKATGDLTIKKILGGFFFQTQATEKGPMGETQFMEIVGYDPANKKFLSNEFHSDGIMFSGTYAVNGNIWTYMGKITVEGKPIMVKNVMTLAADMMILEAKGEISTDGNTWVPWVEAKYTMVMSAPKTK
jgi:roadblock/LC7 domain-containing protein